METVEFDFEAFKKGAIEKIKARRTTNYLVSISRLLSVY